MKKNLFVSVGLAVLSLVYFSNASTNVDAEIQSQFIIQGASQKTILDDLEKVGAEIIHTHSVISAVSAKLTAKQQQTLLTLNPMLRLFKDSKVGVSAKKVKEAETNNGKSAEKTKSNNGKKPTTLKSARIEAKVKFDSKNNLVKWKMASDTATQSTLETVNITWPSANEGIVNVKVNKQAIESSAISANSISLPSTFDLGKQKYIEIEVEFASLNSVDRQDYSLNLGYADGSIDEAAPNILSYKLNDTFFPTLVRANLAHDRGITGQGVTVAIIDTGVKSFTAFKNKTNGNERLIESKSFAGEVDIETGEYTKTDENGHGTHLAGIIADSTVTQTTDGRISYNGIAPDVNLLIVKAFNKQGESSYMDIIRSVEYVIENKDIYDIKVLNLSFSAKPSSYYWDDPLNQVIMQAWRAGITVVAAAGNNGSEAMTIGVPGNLPYVITVGATSDNYTPFDLDDDFITNFSGAGPTYEGFVKPEIVAPGGHIKGFLGTSAYIKKQYAMYDKTSGNSKTYFELSGTSQATAITSGIVALMLQHNPDLSPDTIKCRLLDTARTAITDENQLAYSVFQQGAGLVDAIAAIDSTADNCGNAALNIDNDIANEEHFTGPARFNEDDGTFYVLGMEGSEWSGVYTDSQLWSTRRFSSDSQLWSTRSFDSDSQLWSTRRFDSDSQLWSTRRFSSESLSDPLSIQHKWVEHE
jgi:serine protease AprX